MAQEMASESIYWQAVESRDPLMDDVFFYGVVSTGVYCRPSCGSRLPLRQNVLFFDCSEAARNAGFRPCLRCRPLEDPAAAHREMVERACRYMDNHAEAPVTLTELGRELHVSPFHLQRTFKEVMGITPRAYADSRRVEALREGLQNGHSVTRALYDAGFGSSSRLYERSSSQLGMTPGEYRKRGAGASIRYAMGESPLGWLLVAVTARGVCRIRFDDAPDQLEREFREEFGLAQLQREEAADLPWFADVLRFLEGRQKQLDLPLDLRATAFQRLVWEYLQSIPYGQTQSYAGVAKAMGRPTATRAVARACATNPVALVVPCHRVVATDGKLTGYRWGLERKRALLDMEGSTPTLAPRSRSTD